MIFVLAAIAAAGVGQAPPSPREPADDAALEAKIVAASTALRAGGELVSLAKVLGEKPTAAPSIAHTPERATASSPPDLYDAIVSSVRVVGLFYLCVECDDWHFSGSSGFCVAKDGVVATCRHVLESDETMREAFLVVADLQGHVWPVQRVLTIDRASDVCLLQTTEKGGVPLPLRTNVRTGERVYCLSNPDHHFGFFSEGMVARWYRARESETQVDGALLPVVSWLHVTCAFGAGSSGAPIVDACGNVVGIAQSTTAIVNDGEDGGEETPLVLRTAAPAAALAALMRSAATAGEAR